MKPLYLVGIVVALCAGAVGYALVGTPTSETPRTEAAAPITASPELQTELGALRKEIAGMVARIDSVEARQVVLEGRPAVAQPARTPVGDPAAISEAVSLEDLEKLIAAMKSTGGAGDFESAVLGVIDLKADRDRQEREARRRQQAEDRMNERVTDLTQKLGLNQYQAGEMRTTLVDEQLKREELWAMRAQDDNTNRGQIREQMGALREETNTSLQAFLNADQFRQYTETQGNNRWGGGGATGGGRRRGGN